MTCGGQRQRVSLTFGSYLRPPAMSRLFTVSIIYERSSCSSRWALAIQPASSLPLGTSECAGRTGWQCRHAVKQRALVSHKTFRGRETPTFAPRIHHSLSYTHVCQCQPVADRAAFGLCIMARSSMGAELQILRTLLFRGLRSVRIAVSLFHGPFVIRESANRIIIIVITVYYAEAAKPYNTIKHSKNTVKTTETTEMYKNVIRPSHNIQLKTSHIRHFR